MKNNYKKNKKLSGTINFDPNDKIYLDHFKGNPVIPGSVIINSFYEVLGNSGYSIKNFNIKNFKFKNFLKPANYIYQIEIQENFFLCKLYSNNKQVVSGEIIKCN